MNRLEQIEEELLLYFQKEHEFPKRIEIDIATFNNIPHFHLKTFVQKYGVKFMPIKGLLSDEEIIWRIVS